MRWARREGYDYEPRRSARPNDLKSVSSISAAGTATALGANPRPSAPATPHPGPWQRTIPAASAARSGSHHRYKMFGSAPPPV